MKSTSTKTPTPILMGIVNITPDSFSDGGKFLKSNAAVRHALKLVKEGADILDVGAESTRPGSKPVSEKVQLKRLVPIIAGIRKKTSLPISVDTQSSVVAQACLGEGADIINDISALRSDSKMGKLAASRNCPVILMHMKGTPRTMQKNPRYKDVVKEVYQFFEKRLAHCRRTGISLDKIWLDPGIGFGKILDHNLKLLQGIPILRKLGCPVLIGVSRKSFLGKITGIKKPEKRISASVSAGMFSVMKGAQILRVHDVAEHKQALEILWALKK